MEELLGLNNKQLSEIDRIIKMQMFEYDRKIKERLQYTADMGDLQYLSHKVDVLEKDLKEANKKIDLLIGLLISKNIIKENELENYKLSINLMEKIKENINAEV